MGSVQRDGVPGLHQEFCSTQRWMSVWSALGDSSSSARSHSAKVAAECSATTPGRPTQPHRDPGVLDQKAQDLDRHPPAHGHASAVMRKATESAANLSGCFHRRKCPHSSQTVMPDRRTAAWIPSASEVSPIGL